jgi:ABC-2 type transport system ATP-binding protein
MIQTWRSRRDLSLHGAVRTSPATANQASLGGAAAGSATPAPPIIAFQHVERLFSKDTGVFDLTFEVPAGIIFGLIGPSGCGKTTTLRLLTGLYKPDSGSLSVLGEPPTKFHPRTRQRIGYMPQQFVLYPHLTVSENLAFAASLYGLGFLQRRRRMKLMLDFVELKKERRRLASQLSGGMQRRLGLAAALVHDPQVLFADEPTAGVDPVLRGKFWEQFRLLRDQGRTLFITTQYVGEAAYCDVVAIMRAGRVIEMDTPEGLRRKALGGEVIKLLVNQVHVLQAQQVLLQQDFIHDVRRSREQPGLLLVYVDDAGTRLPTIVSLMSQANRIGVEQAEKYTPPFDDVFIALMEQAGAKHA